MNLISSSSNTNNIPISPRGVSRHGPKVWLKDQPPRIGDRVFPMMVVGKFIDNRTFSQRRVQEWVDSRWRKNGSIVVEKVGSVFMMHCSDIRDRDHLVDLETASLDKALYVMGPWHPKASVQSFTFEYACMWIRVEGLPLNASSTEFVKPILNEIGKVMYFDEETLSPGIKEYLRVKIRIPLNMSLIPGFYFEAVEGEFVWVYLRYENVFIYCKKCGRVGHKSDECRVTVGELQILLGKRMGSIVKNQENVLIEEYHEDMFTSKLIGLKRSYMYYSSAINLVDYRRLTPERVIKRKKPKEVSSDSSSSSEGSDCNTKTPRKRKVRDIVSAKVGENYWEGPSEHGKRRQKIKITVPIYLRRGVPTVAPITVDKGDKLDSSHESEDVQIRSKNDGNNASTAVGISPSI